MMRNFAIAAAAALILAVPAQADTLLDLSTAGAVESATGAVVQQIDPSATGTGVIDSFVRLQFSGKETTDQEGFNTDGTPWEDTKGSIFTHSLSLDSVPVLTFSGDPDIPDGTYRQFMLDINQTKNIDPSPLTLNEIEIWMGDDAASNLALKNADDFSTVTSNGTLVWELDMAGDGGAGDYDILLNYALNAGSGSGDMFLYIEESYFSGYDGSDQLVLYSLFGNPEEANAGFEEWAVLLPEGSEDPNPVPEPGTVALVACGAAFALWRRRKSRNAS